ncbi:mediator of RNA polymerase II transcription subunit 13 [Purpureocillium lilacinum]|uniref:Mediator of RNA polymerase II transcription subunit 13 n=1 Tax=Purpureocillium lilacinum TaxID=33203 RepID=A0A179HVZ4_PURLI|nr:mediator of RNA polymerase II transcription subunit 13 [Purpureocillium lilacinum]OAQ93560.1 mediator of RNA polymerase II transcription subunit 13 [Purpureocillium lilacinum]
MDTAEYDTNTLLISNIASVCYRIYEPSTESSQRFASSALDVESQLRKDGHVVFYDASRRGIWHFRLAGKEGHDNVASETLDRTLETCGHRLLLGAEGTLEPANLQKARPHPQMSQTPTTAVSGASALDPSQRSTISGNTSQLSGAGSQEHESQFNEVTGGDSKAIPPKTVYENFITALLLSISSTFCSRSGATPLNYRTVLLPAVGPGSEEPSELGPENCPVLATLRAYLTTTGALVTSFVFSRCRGLTSLSDTVTASLSLPATPIIAAPFGALTKNQFASGTDPGSASLAQTPNTQALSLRGGYDAHDSMWKQACLKILKLRGVAPASLSDCTWVNLLVPKPRLLDAKIDPRRQQPLGSTVTLPWPGPLCFRKRVVEVSATSRVGDNLLSGHEESHDPLGDARGWFNSAPEREEKLSKRKIERAAVARDPSLADARAPRPSVPSPATIRRPSATAASAIYPTPPDGVQHLNGVTPSFDGTLSSPGNPMSSVPVPDVDPVSSTANNTGEVFDTSSDFHDSKRQRSDVNLLNDAEHMFGDMGGDMFGDNDITDADFNFFDEAPDEEDIEISMDDINDNAVTDGGIQKADEATPNTTDVKAEPAQDRDDAVFAKPELKHARSTQNDNAPQRGRDARTGSMKRESSPFDPHTVFKRVRASLTEAGQAMNTSSVADVNRTTRTFESMSFDPTLPMINKKYEQGGQFDYKKIASTEKPRLEPGLLPETDYLKRHGRHMKRFRERDLQPGVLAKTSTGLDPPTARLSPARMENSLSEDDDSSAGSDEDGSSYTTEEPTSPVKSSVKVAAPDDDVASQVTSARDLDTFEEPDHQLATELPRLSKPDAVELPLCQLFSDPEPIPLELSLGDEDFIQVAQILTDQAAIGKLDICSTDDPDSPGGSGSLSSQLRPCEARNALQTLRESVPSLLKNAGPVSLKGFLDIPDVPFVGQSSRVQPRPVPGRDASSEQVRPSNLYQIPGPHLEVRRSDVKLSVLPSAVTFWESLGLAPSSGRKNLNAVCVFPGWPGMKENVKTFLGRLKSVYEVLKLGSLHSMPLSADLDDGLLPYEVDRISTSPDATMTRHGSSLVESMETLRGAMNNLTVTETNIVVYYVYSPNNPGTIVEACSAFQRYFESYWKSLASQKLVAPNELVLQLVSADLLSAPSSLVVTPGPELVRLCMETYDRCTLFGGPMPAPAIRLEQQLPRIIDFKLTVSPSASLIRENSAIHVAYAQSVDERWVTAAWTDDRGNQQETASYCLGRKGRPQSRSMNEVAHEIWESTLDLISAWKVHWRIIITKCGPMDQQEIDFWVDLARTEIKASVAVILLAVDTSPSLQLVPPEVKLQPPSVPFHTTPVSTPQANIVSPEQSGTPATPARDSNATAATPGTDGAGDSEADAVLVDVTDQTWGALVGHRLNNSSTVLDLHPALVSGYLIKRTGTRIEDAPVLMEVNMVHTDASPRAYEPLLREMLSHFRGLGTLARARGVVRREADVRPWHIAAAEKAVRAMYLLM